MDVNFDLYRIFYITAKAKSISNAAKELYISQPAVSQSIKQLEEKLGGRLFFRTQKGIILTAEGEAVFKYIEQAYNFIMAAQTRFSEMQNLLSGEIRIGASDTLCKYYLLPYLEVFHKEYPELKIQITNRTTQETIKLLETGKVDFGVINLPIQKDSRLEVWETMTIQDCFIVGEKYKEYASKPIHIQELIKQPLLLLEKGSNTRRFIDEYAKVHEVTIVPEIELGSIDLLIEFARIGFGAACVVRNFIDKEIQNSNLYVVQLIEEIPQRKIGIVFLKDVPLSAAAKKFLGTVHNNISNKNE
jgi:LysR family transcriptional regulator, cyn operon transcriptional activator